MPMSKLREPPTRLFPHWMYPPILGVRRNPRPRRVGADVLHDAPEMLFIADDAVEALFLKNRPLDSEGSIDAMRHVALAHLQDLLQFMTGKGSNHQVTMVRHDDPARGEIPLVLEMHQGLRKQLGPSRVAKVASPMALVQPALALAHDLTGVILPVLLGTRLGMRALPSFAQKLQMSLHRARQRIDLPKRHEISRSLLPPVRQMAVIHLEREMRVQTTKLRRRRQMKCFHGHGDPPWQI